MSIAITPTETHPFVLDFTPILKKISDEDFFEFCQLNSDWRIERTSEGELIIMPLRGGIAGSRSFTLTGIFGIWAKADGTGKGFDSSTGFRLPNGADRSPDLAWVELSRWNALTEEERKKFPPLCPDFVVEIRSETDSIDTLKDKMQEYIANGARLGWLIDPKEKQVYIYRPQAEVVCLTNPATVSGDPLLRGFILDMSEIWD
jgi:Uma2 family endonuclease